MTDVFSQYFPMNYFKTMLSPVRSFMNRQYLSIFQQIIVIIFLLGVMMMPLSVQLASIETVDLSLYFPTIVERIDDELVAEMKDAYTLEQARVIQNDNSKYISYLGDAQLSAEEITQPLVFSISRDKIYLKEPEHSMFELNAEVDALMQQENAADFISELGRQFTRNNRLSIYLTGVINIALLVLLNMVGLILGTSFILSFMKNLDRFDINGFKSAFQIVLNTIGLPTMIASLFGFIANDATIVLSFQGLAFIIGLMITYWKTHFNEAYVQRQHINKNRNDEKEVF